MEASLPPYESDGGCLARAHLISCMFAHITPQTSQYDTQLAFLEVRTPTALPKLSAEEGVAQGTVFNK